MGTKFESWETHAEGRYTVWRYRNWLEPDVAVEMRFDRKKGQFTHVRREIGEKWELIPHGPVESHIIAMQRAFAFVGRSDLSPPNE
jgi:hypothetical protein